MQDIKKIVAGGAAVALALVVIDYLTPSSGTPNPAWDVGAGFVSGAGVVAVLGAIG
jgi:hypothetical protein